MGNYNNTILYIAFSRYSLYIFFSFVKTFPSGLLQPQHTGSPKPVPLKAMGGSPLTLMRFEQLSHYHIHSQVASEVRLQGWYWSVKLGARNAGASLLYYFIGNVYRNIWGKEGFSPPVTGSCFLSYKPKAWGCIQSKRIRKEEAGVGIFLKSFSKCKCTSFFP